MSLDAGLAAPLLKNNHMLLFSLQLESVIHANSTAGFPPSPALFKRAFALLLFVIAFKQIYHNVE